MAQRIPPIGQAPPINYASNKLAGVVHEASQSTTNTNVTEQKSTNVEFPYDYKAAAAIGRGITGQRMYAVSPETNPELWGWNKKIFELAKKKGLDPYDVVYWVCQRDPLLQTAARGGFPVNFSHWKNGMEFYDLHMGHKFNLQRIYEMIINNDPSHAYLLEGNGLVDQKLVMSHCMGHSDFFKNNIHFRHTNRNMLNRIAEHASYQKQAMDKEGVSYSEMEKFLEKAYSIDDLIDHSNLEPRELKYELHQNQRADKIPNDFGVIYAPELPSHMQGRINDPERIQKEREVEKKRLDEESQKIPKHPDYDVLGFIIEHSKALKPWQRQMLMHIREQSYYFAPQGLTKIMNEGWAVYWHNKLMTHPEIVDLRDASSFADHNSGTIAMPQRGGLNPYRVGYKIFLDIEERWNTGRHGQKWEEIEDEREKRDYDDKSMKGFEKIFEARKWEKDSTFIDKYLTPEVAVDLKLFTWEVQGEDIKIASRQFEEVKAKLVQQLHRGPAIAVVNGNHDNKGELLLHHDFSYELKKDYAIETLKNFLSMWGNTVHLNTKIFLSEEDKPTPVRVSVENIILVSDKGARPAIQIIWRKAYEEVKEDGSVVFHPASDTLQKLVEEVNPQ